VLPITTSVPEPFHLFRETEIMKRNVGTTSLALVLFAAASPVPAQPRPDSANVPVTRITLFSSGVGYFHREGEIDGNARIDLQFPQEHINDLLKSLVSQDTGGGRVATIHYDNRNPIDKTLKSFAIDLTGNPSFAQLLHQARGEKIELVTYADKAASGQAETISGLIVGVEHQKHAAGKDQVIDVAQLNVLTADGLRGVPLGTVQRVRFLKPALEEEFRKALEVLATGHDKQKKTVTLNFNGEGRRSVRVGYVTESPIWKTSYRLKLDKDALFLQGWAIVENTTDDDWNNVRLGLVSGRPISFQMDLYEPLFVSRPVVEPELFASLRPPTYQGNLADQLKANAAGGSAATSAAQAAQLANQDLQRQREAQLYARHAVALGKDATRLNFQQGVASVATTTELGEYFEYAIEKPVSLPRQKSALLPIVNQPVGGTRVSIYNPNVHAKFPLLGLRFKNTTKLHLNQGPITVFEGNGYAGDARIADLQPGETRLLSYAIDLGTEVAPEASNTPDSLLKVKAYKGILYASFKVRQSKTYVIKNRSEHERTVLIEHPFRADWQLVSPAKPAERARDVYRFEVAAAPNKTVKQEVVEEQTRVDQVALSNSPDEAVRVFLRSTISSSKVKAALEEALSLKAKLEETRNLIRREEEALKVIEQDQARMRANMAQVPQTSEAYKRYLKKFDDQETEIEKRREKISKLQDTAEKLRKEFDDFLLKLDVE
jgi:hypothetical protein